MTVRVNHRTLLRQGRVFKLTVEDVTFPNGYQLELEIIRHPGAAAIVPLDADDQVLMLKQYRHAIGGFIWEIPAGTIDGDEQPLACARRELTEETGCSAARWETMGAITPVPGYSDEKIHLFLARDIISGTQRLEADEIAQVHRIPLQRVVTMIFDGTIEDAKTIAAILKTMHRLQR